MREKIEASGHEARWEFSRQLLFESTNYAAEVRGVAAGRGPCLSKQFCCLGTALGSATLCLASQHHFFPYWGERGSVPRPTNLQSCSELLH